MADIGFTRAKLAPQLTGEQLAELLALAEMTICAGGSLSFAMHHTHGVTAQLISLGIIEATRPPELGLAPGTRLVRMTKLGWCTLLTRCEQEMAHLLPPDEQDEE